jgi:DNA-binding response OmpR family regulator
MCPREPRRPRHRLRIVVLNGSAPVLKMLCQWLEQHGHHCATALLADMPQAHEEVGRFIQKHPPDVVIYDVGMPYASSWDLLEVIRTSSDAK